MPATAQPPPMPGGRLNNKGHWCKAPHSVATPAQLRPVAEKSRLRKRGRRHSSIQHANGSMPPQSRCCNTQQRRMSVFWRALQVHALLMCRTPALAKWAPDMLPGQPRARYTEASSQATSKKARTIVSDSDKMMLPEDILTRDRDYYRYIPRSSSRFERLMSKRHKQGHWFSTSLAKVRCRHGATSIHDPSNSLRDKRQGRPQKCLPPRTPRAINAHLAGMDLKHPVHFRALVECGKLVNKS